MECRPFYLLCLKQLLLLSNSLLQFLLVEILQFPVDRKAMLCGGECFPVGDFHEPVQLL
jgi:hypothetical protein